MKNHPSAELKLMILEYQTVFIQNINMRYGTAVSMHNPRHINMLKYIWEAAKVDQIDIPGVKKWKKIGFTVSLYLCAIYPIINLFLDRRSTT